MMEILNNKNESVFLNESTFIYLGSAQIKELQNLNEEQFNKIF
jgi:hypothetical protein